MKNDIDLQKQLERIKFELDRLYLVSNAMRTTLKLEEIFFVILTSVTAKEGLGFNRAMLFLANKEQQILEGQMGVGPQSGEEAARIWRQIEEEKITFDELITTYEHFSNGTTPNTLNTIVKTLKIPLQENYCLLAMTALEGMPFEVTTPNAQDKVNPYIRDLLGLDNFVTVPLMAKEKVLGIIVADNKFSGKTITKEDIKILSMFANQAGLAIENSRLYEEKERMSQIDFITGLYNHGHFQFLLSREIKRAEHFNQPLSLIMADVDDFKNYNDIFGHQTGDELLKVFSGIITANLRKIDFAARYGGDEFIIALPDILKKEAVDIAHRIRKEIEGFNFEKKEVLATKKLNLSLGVAGFPQDAADKNGLIYAADRALYQAKKAGRNTVRTA